MEIAAIPINRANPENIFLNFDGFHLFLQK